MLLIRGYASRQVAPRTSSPEKVEVRGHVHNRQLPRQPHPQELKNAWFKNKRGSSITDVSPL